MFGLLFRKDRLRIQAETLYVAVSDRALAPEFFGAGGVADTPEGRFDMLTLHLFLAIDRLRKDGPAHDRLIRYLQEAFFRSLDSALRELGVGDLSVGKKIRALAEAFYGRLSAYEKAADEESDALESAIARNVLGTGDAARAQKLAGYVRAARRDLHASDASNLTESFRRLRDLRPPIIREVSGETIVA